MANLLTCYYRPKPGGFCRRLFQAIEALLDSGHNVHYLAVIEFPIQHERCFFHRFPWPAEKTETILFWSFFLCVSPVMLLFLAVRYRVSHLFAFSPTYAFLLKPTAWFKRIDLTCFIRGDAHAAHKLNRQSRWIIKLDGWIEGVGVNGSRIVGVQRHLTQQVLGRHPKARPERTLWAPNNLPRAEPRPKTYHFPLRIGLVGMLEPMKNQKHAIDLIKKLPAEAAELHIYGKGPLSESLRNYVRVLGLSDRVRFMGWVRPPIPWDNVDLLLMPSIHEGMPNAVLEAIANHVAVIASDIPAHRDVLPAGHLLPLDDMDAWVEALSAVLRDLGKKLTHMVTDQNLSAESFHFNWSDRIVKAIIPSEKRCYKRRID